MDSTHRTEWFQEWFNSPYYHLLYKQRDEQEAEMFLRRLLKLLDLPKGATILDLACGKGRHAVFLNKQGFDVTGLDLSAESIAYASLMGNDSLNFYQHDMRKPFRINYFDCIVNLFTSFGYFSDPKDDQATLHAISAGLKPGGIFVFDFFSRNYTIAHLQQGCNKRIGEIEFQLKRWEKDDFIYKHIHFVDKGKTFDYEERVKTYSLEQFTSLLNKNDMQALTVKGNYALEDYRENESERMIVIAQKQYI